MSTSEFWNGNMAAAQAVKRARVQHVAAYPITPQTHTVEYLSEFVNDGELDARLVKVESEHSALSACAGASAIGARTFTASCSQGLQLMSEVMYFTSGMRFPVVMAVANRTLSVPVNIWPDHQDTLVNRDSGWLQIYCGSVQEAYDMIFCAFKVAEDDEVALPAIVASLTAQDAGIRSAAVDAVGVLGQEQQAADLVGMLQKTASRGERESIEKALLAVAGRSGTKCIPHLRPLTESSDEQLQMIGLHALAIVGGPEALATVKSAMAGDAGEVQDEAVRILSTWPNNWPDDADAGQTLLSLAKSGGKMSHKVLGLRGYLTYVRGNTNLTGSQKVAKVKDLLPLIERPEEERLAIAALGEAPDPAALEMLTQFTQDPAVAEEAYSAIVNLATKDGSGLSRQQRREALQTALEKSKNNATRLRARRALRRM